MSGYAYLVTSDVPLAALVDRDARVPLVAPSANEENGIGFAPVTATMVGVAQITARRLPDGATVSFPVLGGDEL